MTKFYSKFRAQVSDVNDPLKIGRVKLRVPAVYGDTESDWASPIDRFTWMPEVDDRVWAEFVGGDPNKPLYSGRWIPQPGGDSALQTDAKEGFPNVRVFDSPDGSKMVFDAANNTIKIVHKNGTTILTFDNNGDINYITESSMDMQCGALKGIKLSNGTTAFPIIVAGSLKTPCLFFGTPHISTAAPPIVTATP